MNTAAHGTFVRPERFGREEWEARVQLAAAYRIGAGQDAFDAMQRMVDRIDPSYRS